MKTAIWSALGVYAVALLAAGAFRWMVRSFISQPVRQMMTKLLISSTRS